MFKITRTAFVASLLSAACSAGMAANTTFNLGTLTSAAVYIGNTFNQAQTFTDTYTFTINAASSVGGYVQDYAASVWFRDVNITSLQLFAAGASTPNFTVTSVPDTYSFTFSGLQAGSYSLLVNGYVSNGLFSTARDTAQYDGFISAAPSVASGAPEASDALMAAMGLMGVGFWARARKTAKK
jgi:hypothetical protein